MEHKYIDFHRASQSYLLITLGSIPISDSVAGSNWQDMTYGPQGPIAARVGKWISTTRCLRTSSSRFTIIDHTLETTKDNIHTNILIFIDICQISSQH